MMPHYMGPSNSLVVRIKCLKTSFLVRDIVQVIQVVSNGYRYVLGLGLEPDNVLDKLYDHQLYGSLE